MSAPATSVQATDIGRLSAEASHRLWLDVLASQGLAGGEKPHTAEEAAHLSLGLHAARLPSPFTTLLARLQHPDAADAIFGDHQPRAPLVTVRCMRKTLHTLPARMAGTAHTATRHFRERDARRLAHNAGLSGEELSRLIAEVENLVGEHGPLGHRDIEAMIPPARCTLSGLRAALKVAWEVGLLTYLNASPHWNREVRRFALTEHHAPDITSDAPREPATRALVLAYFERYGPASVRDAVWWSGLSQRAVIEALRRSDRDLCGLTTPWSDAILYLFADQQPHLARRPGHDEAVDFLAHEDVALKAYFSTRRRYLDAVPARYVFNQIGEVLPTILRDGRVVGRWGWNRRHRCVTVDLSAPDRGLVRVCAQRADRLTADLRRRHDGT